MLVDNAGGKEFKPDPLLDLDRDYEARIAGLIHIGKHQKQKHDGKNFIDEYDEIEQAIVWFELTEEDTFVERGPDDAKTLAPRYFPKFVKYSSHEKAALFEMAKAANPKSAYVESKKGKVDTGLMIGHPVSLTLKNNKDGDKQNIAKIGNIPAKYKSGVAPLQGDMFQYSVHSGPHPVGDVETTIEDVPVWMLAFAIREAVDVDQFGQIEVMEEYLQQVEDAKDKDTELEGDRLEKKDSKKSDDKAKSKAKSKAKDEPKSETKDEVKDEVKSETKDEAKPTSSRRQRRTAAKKEAEVDYSGMETNDIEDAFVKLGGTDDALDALSVECGDNDDAYKDAVIAAIKEL